MLEAQGRLCLKFSTLTSLAGIGLLVLSIHVNAATPYDTALLNAASYLANTQNTEDGSWGSADNIKPLQTAEVIQALRAYNQRTRAYYAGIAWLENHRTPNVDYTARRIMALNPTGDDVSADLAYLVQSQNATALGNNGWGVSPSYQGSVIDTALTIQALNSISSAANTATAATYLQSLQLTGTDKGWPVASETSSDPIATAQAIIALTPKLGAASSVITNGVTTLRKKVTTTSSANSKALAALAYVTVNPASADATVLLSNLQSTQAADGSIGGDAYTTAIAMRGFAISIGKAQAALSNIVTVKDPNLRNAINLALGKNALDNLNKGELANLYTLDISNLGIKDLTGLEAAVNLTSLNASNNNITSTAPLAGLTQLTQVNLAGNPVYTPPVVASADVPTLPEWGEILMALLLLYQLYRHQRRSSK